MVCRGKRRRKRPLGRKSDAKGGPIYAAGHVHLVLASSVYAALVWFVLRQLLVLFTLLPKLLPPHAPSFLRSQIHPSPGHPHYPAPFHDSTCDSACLSPIPSGAPHFTSPSFYPFFYCVYINVYAPASPVHPVNSRSVGYTDYHKKCCLHKAQCLFTHTPSFPTTGP
jgi:hypothetical protein